MDTTSQMSPGGPREEQSSLLVLICGLITTALALLGVYLLDEKTTDFHIMGWYADYVIPAGAFIVGIAASSGYGLASWYSGVKITKRLLWTVLVLQFLAYWSAQYIDFSGRHLVHYSTGERVGFLEYFDLSARMMAWKDDHGETGQPLGALGYGVRILEILGFVGGGLIVPLVMRKSPYCDACQRYMRTRQMAFVPASIPAKKVKKSDTAGLAAYQAGQQQAFDTGKATIESMQQLATANKTGDFQKMLVDLKMTRKQTVKLPGRLNMQLVYCRRCYDGSLVTKLMVGQGNQIKQTEFSRATLHPEFVRSVCV